MQSCWPRLRSRHRALPQRAPPRAEARRTSETERLQISGLPAPDRRTEGAGARREPCERALAARSEPSGRRLPPPPRDPAWCESANHLEAPPKPDEAARRPCSDELPRYREATDESARGTHRQASSL